MRVASQVRGKRDLVTLVGHAPAVTPGEYASASGNWVNDREHGRQFRAVLVKIAAPNTLSDIERYLGSGTETSSSLKAYRAR